MYRYHQSGSLGTLNFIWKVPKEEKDQNYTKLVETVESIKSTIPVNHTRAMRRKFKEKFKGIPYIPTVVLDEMYRTLTSDGPAVANPVIRRRLMLFLDADYDYTSDDSVVVDLGSLNEGKSKHLEKVLQDYSEAADARRLGEAHLPVAISIPDLKKTVLETIPCDQREDVVVPSDECVRLQFIPVNEHVNSSINDRKLLSSQGVRACQRYHFFLPPRLSLMDVNWKIFWLQERVGMCLLSWLCIQMGDLITEQHMDLFRHLFLEYLSGTVLTC